MVTLLAIAAMLAAGGLAGDAMAEPSLGLDGLAQDGQRPPRTHLVNHRHDDDDDDHDYDDHDDEDFEEDLEDLEIERVYVEMERASLETLYGAMELVEKIRDVAGDDDGVAALAVVSIKDAFEPEEAIKLLEEVVRDAPSKVARRVARLQLAELHGELGDEDRLRSHLRALIFSPSN